MTAYTATVTVRLKRGVLDPEAETTKRALDRLGFELDALRSTDRYEIDLDAVDAEGRRRAGGRDGRATPGESDHPRLRRGGRAGRMTVAVIRFGGSNCDRDSVQALEHLGIDAEIVWHEDGLPEDVSGIMLPGGFSYGDYLRAGAMAARSPIMAEVRDAANDGVPVLGVCNGAQVGCESQLTPGAFTTNESARFQCEHVHLRVENADTPWTSAYDEGEVVELPIAHGEGRYEIDDDRLDELEADDRILFKLLRFRRRGDACVQSQRVEAQRRRHRRRARDGSGDDAPPRAGVAPRYRADRRSRRPAGLRGMIF